LQNARQYEQAERQANREAIVNTIGQKIQQAGSIEDVLQVAVRELGQALGARQTNIQLERQAQLTPNGAPKAAKF
jgi:GAF domain-containing protein